MHFSMRSSLAFLAVIPLLCGAANAQTSTINLTVDAAAGTHAIDPNIYGMSNYGLDAAFAKEIKLPNYRWGGDGTTRYNWMVDSSNSGNDWYFVGGSGEENPTPGGQVDKMIATYSPAGAKPLITGYNGDCETLASVWKGSLAGDLYQGWRDIGGSVQHRQAAFGQAGLVAQPHVKSARDAAAQEDDIGGPPMSHVGLTLLLASLRVAFLLFFEPLLRLTVGFDSRLTGKPCVQTDDTA